MDKRVFIVLVLVLVGVRIFHLTPEIEDPHAWRQCDTAYYAYDFYKNGVDLMRPQVCWMGNQSTLILEFPLPEAIMAIGYEIFGFNHLVSKVITLMFFLGSVFLFYSIIKDLLHEYLARWSTILYLSLPISLFYSTAIHIDFYVVFFSHLMLYSFLKSVKEKSMMWMSVATVSAAIGLMVKAPYIVYFIFPFIFLIHHYHAWKWVLKNIYFLLVPILLFYFWQQYSSQVNYNSPDWDFIPQYRKMTYNPYWYFGTWSQKLSLYPWKIFSLRIILDVCGGLGFLFLLSVLLDMIRVTIDRITWWWLGGVILFGVIFFNLNVYHNYYQIPFLAPVSLLISYSLLWVYKKHKSLAYLMLGSIILSSYVFVVSSYYIENKEYNEIGDIIKDSTIDSDLPIITYGSMDCRNPQILYRAKRRGWSILENEATYSVVKKLKDEENATHWFYVSSSEHLNLPDSAVIQGSKKLTTSGKYVYRIEIDSRE